MQEYRPLGYLAEIRVGLPISYYEFIRGAGITNYKEGSIILEELTKQGYLEEYNTGAYCPEYCDEERHLLTPVTQTHCKGCGALLKFEEGSGTLYKRVKEMPKTLVIELPPAREPDVKGRLYYCINGVTYLLVAPFIIVGVLGNVLRGLADVGIDVIRKLWYKQLDENKVRRAKKQNIKPEKKEIHT